MNANVPLHIEGGNNGSYDPVRDMCMAARTPVEQDPAVQARCPEVVAMAASLCLRYPGEPMGQEVPNWTTVNLTVPDVVYHSELGDEGTLRLGTRFFTTKIASGLHVVEPDQTMVTLSMRATPESGRKTLFALWPGAFIQHSIYDLWPRHENHAGGHSELNFFIGIIDKMRDAAFPRRNPADTEAAHHTQAAVRLPEGAQTGVALRRTVDTSPL